MKIILRFFFRYLVFWLFYFVIIRAVFIIYHIKPFAEENAGSILATFAHGFRMDLSMASYFCMFPFLLISLSIFGITVQKILKVIRYYTYILLGILSLLTVVDMELFSFWGYRLDGTPLKYMNTPGEMLASSLSSPWYILIPVMVLLFIVGVYMYRKLIDKLPYEALLSIKSPVVSFALLALIIAVLIVPIRGGFQQIPMNESTVYFSSSNLVNQTTVNLPWSFIHSLLEKSYSDENPYEYSDDATADALVKELYTTGNDSSYVISDPNHTNVLIILWESFTSKADVDSVTPEFNRLKKEGIFFSHLYGTGDRSDKGIVGVLSGYPALPVPSIIMNPNKSRKLPSLTENFTLRGYNSAFYYGGELAFANMNTYLTQHNFKRMVSIKDFDKKDMNSKWGAHDEIVLRRVLTELDTMVTPFFSMAFTLSSHEPFEIPIKPKFEGTEKATLFLNSLYYTDYCLGNFIEEAKKKPWWKNTLVIVVADHGHVLPGSYYASHKQSEFRIPMLWLGGALTKKNLVIDKIASQTDLAITLNMAFGRIDNAFTFSRNILSPDYKESAYYAFNDGFGFIKPEGYFLYDNISKTIIDQEGTVSEQMIRQGKAFQQVTYRDYLNK